MLLQHPGLLQTHPTSFRGAGRQWFWTVCWTRMPPSKAHLYNKSLWNCYHRPNMLRLLLTGCFWAVSYMYHMWEQFVAASTHLPHTRERAALELEPIVPSVTFELSPGSGGKYSNHDAFVWLLSPDLAWKQQLTALLGATSHKFKCCPYQLFETFNFFLWSASAVHFCTVRLLHRQF